MFYQGEGFSDKERDVTPCSVTPATGTLYEWEGVTTGGRTLCQGERFNFWERDVILGRGIYHKGGGCNTKERDVMPGRGKQHQGKECNNRGREVTQGRWM